MSFCPWHCGGPYFNSVSTPHSPRRVARATDTLHDECLHYSRVYFPILFLTSLALRELIPLFCFLQLFDLDEDGYISEEEFSTILQASLGVPDLDGSGLFKEISQGDSVSYGE